MVRVRLVALALSGVAALVLAGSVLAANASVRITESNNRYSFGPAKVFVPQHHPPGLEAEVDFGELWVRLAGVLVKCYHNDLDSRTSGRL